MGFDPTDTISIGMGITAFATTITTVFLFVTASHERLARMLGYTMGAFAAWAWFGFAYHLTDDLWLAREFRILSILFQTIGQALSVQYAYTYLTEIRRTTMFERILYWFLMIASIILFLFIFADLFGTQFVAGEVLPGSLTPERGPVVGWYFTFYFFIAASVGLILGKRVVLEKGDSKRAGAIIAISMVTGYLMGSTGFLTWYDITSNIVVLRGLAIPLFIVAAFFTITNYRLFNLRVAAAEVFVFAMWGFLFLRVLLNPTFEEAIPDIGIFLAVIVLGLLLIRNVTQELAVRIKLEEVSEELRVLNGSLEARVIERTEELARSQRHIEQVVEHLPVGLIEIEADQTIARMNEVAERLLGIKRATALATDRHTHQALTTLLGNTLTPGVFDAEITSPHVRDVEVAVAPLSLEKGEGFIVIIRDVTDKRSLERAKNDFVATAAHQLRTPLAAIKWTFDLLGSNTLNEQQLQVVERGKTGVNNMERIAEGLLMSVRTAEGMSKYSFEKTDITAIIKEISALLLPLAEKKHIRLASMIAPHLPLLSIDIERIKSALQNLIDNAIKYTPEGGAVTVTAQEGEHGVVITVSDSGIGISPEDQEHLFEKFFRARKATEMFTDGSGLGLAIVKSIVEAHGGSITVTSKEGSGSTFSITLPTGDAHVA